MRSVLVLALLVILYCNGFGQTGKIDGLRYELYSVREEHERLNILLALLNEDESLPVDSLWNYALQTQALASATGDRLATGFAILGAANAYLRWNNADSARRLIEPELKHWSARDDYGRGVYFKLARARLDCMDLTDDLKEATAADYDLMREAEQCHDSVVVAECANSLAAWNYDLDFEDEAKRWSYRALASTSNTPRFYQVLGSICFNLGETYRWLHVLDSAEYYTRLGLDYGRKSENLYYISHGLQKIAWLLTEKKQFAEAERNILESIALERKIDGDKPSDAKVIVLANVYKSSGQLDKAIAVLTDGLRKDSIFSKIANHQGHVDMGDMQQMFLFDLLGDCYKSKGDHLNYERVLEKIISAKDTIYQQNSASAMAELQTKYEVQKKEATIANQRLALIKDRYMLYGSLVIACLGAVIAWLIIRNIRRAQRLRFERLQEEEKHRAAQAVAAAEETERRRIAADLHDNLGAQLSFIRRNVNFILDQPGGFSEEDERKYLGYVNDTAKAAMIDLRETIWVLNRFEVGVQEFADKLKSYLRQQLQEQEAVRWTFSEQLQENWRLPSGEVMHLFRIMQEVVSNIIKHSAADTIQICFDAFGPGAYRIEVTDNGQGFDVNGKYEGHYGMENIHHRAQQIGAALLVESRVSSGTRVVLEKGLENTAFALLHKEGTIFNIAD